MRAVTAIRPGRALRAAGALAAAVVALTGCQLSQLSHLQFTRDTRLTFTSPEPRSLVTMPLTISWTMRGFDTATGMYAVFVDLAPIGVGRTLRDVGKDDPSCRRDPACPDAAYLSGRGVYPTTLTSVTLDVLPKPPTGVGDEQHFATVILLDAAGVRRTESAWYVEFRFPRRS